MKNDDVIAAIATLEAYQAAPTIELVAAVQAALELVPGVWIIVGGRRYRATRPTRDDQFTFQDLPE